MEDRIEIDLSIMFKLLFKKKWLILLSIVISFIIFFCGSMFLLTPTYTSNVKLYVNSNQQQVSEGITINDINASQKLVETYIVILTDDEVLNSLYLELQNHYDEDQLKKYLGDNSNSYAQKLHKMIRLSAVNNTEVLQIEAETINPEFSADICMSLAKITPSILQRVVKAGSIEIIGEAKPDYQKSGPNNLKNGLIGATFVGLLVIGIILARNLLDNTIKGEQDLKDKLDIQVLGEIPDFSTGLKGGYYGK